MSDSKFYPGASGDDYYYGGESEFYGATDHVIVGRPMSTSYHAGFRFHNVGIAPGAIIVSAHITFHANETLGGNINVNIYGNDADDAVAPTSRGEAGALVWTDAFVPWTPPDMTLGEEYDTPDISEIIREITNRPGWGSGNALQLLIANSSSATGRKLRSKDHANEATDKPELHIVYFNGESLDFTSAPMTMTLTMEGEVFAPAGLNRELPGLVCEGTLAVRSGSLDEMLPGFLISASGGVGTYASLDQILPGFLIEARSGHFADITLSGFLIEAAGLTGGLGRVSGVLSGLIITASGKAAQVGSLDRNLSGLEVSAHGYSEVLGGLETTLPGLTIEATGFAGAIGRANLTLPGFAILASAIHENRLSADLVLPGFVLTAEGQAVPVFITCIVMNPKNLAVSEYTNFNFNSFAFFNGKYLAAGPSGIHVLEGDTDNGEPIISLIKTGHIPTGSARARDIYLMGRSDAQMRVTLIGDEEEESREEADYLISQLGQDRVVTPRGMDPVYLQIAVENSQGGDFDLDSIEVFGEGLKRRGR